MSEATEQLDFALHEHPHLCALYTVTDSIKIIFRNLKLFISIFTLTIFPLALLLFSLALYSRPLRTQIRHLEAVASLSHSSFEARQMWKQVRVDSATLLWLKALFWIPCYALSLLAMITSVNSTALTYAGTRPNLQTAVSAVLLTWKRTLVTSIFVFVIMVIYVHLMRKVTAWIVWSTRVQWLMVVSGAVLEVELMAVLSFAMVVSVLEERFGWEAIKIGWRLMEGRRFTGWILAGFLGLVSGGIGWGFRVSMYGQDETMVVVIMGLVDQVGLICLYGLIVLWGYVVYTVFYCECRTIRRGNRVDTVGMSILGPN